MKPIDFKHSNIELSPPNAQYSDNVTEVTSIRAYTDGEQCVSCWKMTWRERVFALVFGKAWLSLLSGKTMPPAHVAICKEYLEQTRNP